MLKRLFFLHFVFAVFSLSAQITTNPSLVVQQSGTAVTVTFDVSQIPALAGNAGPLYVHTGVLTASSAGSGDWKYVFTDWPNGNNASSANTSKNTLTSSGSNKWQLTVSPDINAYYGINAGDKVTQLAFVVRTADGSKQSSDLFVPVYQPGLNTSITSPANNSVIQAGKPITISAIASNGSQACTLNLYVGATTASNITGTTAIASGTNSASVSYTFANTANYYVIAKSASGSLTKSDTSYVCVVSQTTQPSVPRPTGLKEGLTKYPGTDSVTFCLSLGYAAPVDGNTKIFLLGDFNDYKLDGNYMMNRDVQNASSTTNPYGVPTYFYWLTVRGLDPNKEYAYQYYVSNNAPVRVGDPYCEKILDPGNDKYISSTIYPNLRAYPSGLTSGILSCFQINAPSYQWQTSNFTPPAQSNLQIYEMLFRDFTPEGSVKAAIQKLDYLKDLGINAVELMPIMEFDGNNSWGYNPNFFFAPDKAYGTKQDYQQFVDECHKRGIAVILDIVLNHTWGLSPYCMIYWDATNNRPLATNPYYNVFAPHPYSVGNDLNHSYPVVKAWLSRALQFWLTEYKVDGFRFDLSKGYTQTVSKGGQNPTTGAAAPSSAPQAETLDQSRINIIEGYVDAMKAVNPNAYPIMEHFCADNEENTLAAYKGTMLWRNMNNAFCQAAMGYSSQSDFSGLVSTGGSLALPTNRVAYAESHDEYRMGYKAITWGLPPVQDATNVMQQLAVCGAFLFLSPGPRMMWEFGELGANYNSKTADGSGNLMDPVPAQWNNLNIPARKQLHDVYTKVLNFRQQYSSLFDNPASWNWQVSQSDWDNGRRVYLQNNDITVVVLGNFTTTPVTSYPSFGKTGTWYELLSGSAITVTDPNMVLPLNPFDVRIYTDKAVYTGIPTVTNSSVTVYPNPVVDNLYIAGKDAKTIEIRTANGAVALNLPVSGNTVSLASLPTGIYIGKITFSDGLMKVVKISKK